MTEDAASNSDLQRGLGRIEGAVSGLVTTVQSLAAQTAIIQQGIAAIVADNHQCHEDRIAHGRRLDRVEHRQFWVAGASATLGLIAGALSSPLLNHFWN
jgi:hypothetical protein